MITMGSLEEGARNAVETCVSVKAGEYVLVVTDKNQYRVGNAIFQAARKITPHTEIYVLDDYLAPYLYRIPKDIVKAINKSDVSFWTTSSKWSFELENKFIQLAMKNPERRHAHMSGITRRQMETAMCVDYKRVERLTEKVYELVKDSKKIRIEDPDTSKEKRTKLIIELNRQWRWVKSPGIIKRWWDNLPEGEVFTTPYRVNGSVATTLMGDYFDEKYGILDPPAYFEVKDSRILLDTLDCKENLRSELSAYLKKGENCDRASEIAMPTNPALISESIVGGMLIDEKGKTHIGFGATFADETGADWDCSESHIDFILEGCNVSVDDKPLMKLGKYLFDIN
jgi:leucyl aminopeptidase (aminopeptidase T)